MSAWRIWAAALVVAAAGACAISQLEKNLSPENAEFLSKVRYIITSEEKATFLHLPDSEKPGFIEEFWKRRDPDPETEENEFKNEYFERINKADELFFGEGKPGWLTDRGRIYILFGPPTDRMTSPTGSSFYGRCQELWYYGTFPVIFIDADCSGHFVLVTIDLSHLNDLNLALATAQRPVLAGSKRSFLDFTISLKKKMDGGNRFEGLVIIEVPYRLIWLSAEGDKLKTILEAALDIRDSRDKLLWEFKRNYEIRLSQAELAAFQDQTYIIEIPFILNRSVEELREGKNKLHVALRNSTGKEEVRKTAEFSL